MLSSDSGVWIPLPGPSGIFDRQTNGRSASTPLLLRFPLCTLRLYTYAEGIVIVRWCSQTLCPNRMEGWEWNHHLETHTVLYTDRHTRIFIWSERKEIERETTEKKKTNSRRMLLKSAFIMLTSISISSSDWTMRRSPLIFSSRIRALHEVPSLNFPSLCSHESVPKHLFSFSLFPTII